MLTLTFGSRSVVIAKFPEKKLPRIRVNPAQADYNAPGTPVVTGTTYEPKFLWSVNCLLLPVQYQKLQAIYSASESARRASSSFAITLDDQSEPIVEATRSRALVPATVEETLGSDKVYFARFSVAFVKPPEATVAGAYYAVQFSLAELETVAP